MPSPLELGPTEGLTTFTTLGFMGDSRLNGRWRIKGAILSRGRTDVTILYGFTVWERGEGISNLLIACINISFFALAGWRYHF